MPKQEASRYLDLIENADLITRTGKVMQFHGLIVEASGPDAFLGEICEVYANTKKVLAEVVGFKENRVLLVPFDNIRGVNIGSEVVATGRAATIPVGEHLVGRVLDAFGRPLDGKPLSMAEAEYPLYPDPVNPMTRSLIDQQFVTGVKAIDLFTPIGIGQRMGIFAGSGVGKSTLLGSIAANITSDVNVIVLVGERGREVNEFVEMSLGASGLEKSIVIVATADQHPLVRAHAAYAGTAIGEYFKDKGKNVLLAMDSITRFAMAHRDIGLAAGEPPALRGYTPSTFTVIPRLLERAGSYKESGTITAFYTVLVEGDDFNEPVSDNLRAILDGHLILTRERANRGQFPAVDINQSVSRLISHISTQEHIDLVRKANRLQSIYNDSKDVVQFGGYNKGVNKELDQALAFCEKLENLLSQNPGVVVEIADAISQLRNIVPPSL